MPDLQIEPVLTPDALRAYHAVSSAVMDHDHTGLPEDPFEEYLPDLTPGPDEPERNTYWLGTSGGEVVAVANAFWPLRDNLNTAGLGFSVHPDHRRRGHGRAMLEHLLGVLRESGRSRAWLEVCSPWEGGSAPADPLLRAAGARPALAEARRLLDLTALTPAAQPGPTPAGYRVEQWIDKAPDELVDGLAYLSARMSTDAPKGDLELEPEVWDAERYRKREENAMARNRMRICTAVVHEQSGDVVGTTDYGVNASRHEIAYQWDTIVEPKHRGHALGLLLKAHNVQLLTATLPDCRWVNTWNAVSNTHMVAVNDALGFVPVELWTEWQLHLASEG